ncbi:hypothetical protein [Polaromonas sp. LjRoot131]|uniref:hypothetical protein n=1 Tax=Polaromonas sp. LjRoot131 TaxID=3342262 RepID=UPI003ED0AD22
MRFIGVQSKDFNEAAFSEDGDSNGVETFVFDVHKQARGNGAPRSAVPRILEMLCNLPEDCEICYGQLQEWYRIDFHTDVEGRSYFYPTFGRADPSPVTVRSITRLAGPKLTKFRTYSYVPGSSSKTFALSTFEVGQGMASLIYSESEGFLIDAGAGTPIRRDAYVKNQLSCNQLLDRVQGKQLRFFLSHADTDHWRMLGWDDRLIAQIKEFVIPSDMKSVAFFDIKVKSKVRELASHLTISLTSDTTLSIFRTDPPRKTSNNDGLVFVFEKKRKKALLAGDCTYVEMLQDGNIDVRQLPHFKYVAVVVPHHGDERSSKNVPLAEARGIAFFSAGNHAKFRHPRKPSKDAHQLQGFKNHIQKNPTGIREKKLM